MKPGISFNFKLIKSAKSSWTPSFPNPADFRFDYFKLMEDSPHGLATLPAGAKKRVAVVGAGVAGMTAARELLRCGFEVTLFEASSRIGGRLFTQHNPNGETQAQMEMGAMRMPFFTKPDSHNSLLAYYLNFETKKTHPLQHANFPNPGAAPGNTGIYLNRGLGPNLEFTSPHLIAWPDGQSPDNPTLKALSEKVDAFGKDFSIPAKMYYNQDNDHWTICWDKIVAHYESMTFNALVLAPKMNAQEITQKVSNLSTFDGDLGGMGMNASEAQLLYTIGVGDGSWGAFYSIAALWFLRCTYFGFSSNLQTIEGFAGAEKMPHFNKPVKDSKGRPLQPPLYEGIQGLVEYLFYVAAPNMKHSLYEAAKLYVNTPVTRIEKQADGSILLKHGTDHATSHVDYVIVTATQWATQMSIDFVGFSEAQLPQNKITGQNTQHNISSCKLFFPLKDKFWQLPGNKIPQVIITDTFVQDTYALSWTNKPQDKGVLLASYTWEDDSLKLLPFNEKELATLVLEELSNITKTTVGQDIAVHVDHSKPVMLQWIKQPTYIGCSKLYRAENEAYNLLDLSYNQNYGKLSSLYYAGENYSVEGGWTEPALRSAMDCVLQLLHHSHAKFNALGFDFARDYPKWPKR
jgi:monoamine oxidase